MTDVKTNTQFLIQLSDRVVILQRELFFFFLNAQMILKIRLTTSCGLRAVLSSWHAIWMKGDCIWFLAQDVVNLNVMLGS